MAKRDEFSTGQESAARVKAFGGRAVTGSRPAYCPSPPPVSPKDAGQADAQKVAEAAKRSPKEGTKLLETLVANNPDPAYRAALLEGSKESLTQMGTAMAMGALSPKDVRVALTSLSNLAALTAPDSTVAEAFTRGVPMMGVASLGDHAFPAGPLAIGFTELLISGAPGSGALLTGMMNAAKGPARADLEKLIGYVAGGATKAFDDARQRVGQLNGELQKLVAGFGPGADPKVVEQAVADFKERHAKEYAALDAAGAALTPLLEAAPALLKNAKNLPFETVVALMGVTSKAADILQTPAGQASLSAALVAQSEGKPSMLDDLVDFAKNLDDKGELAKKLTTLVTQSMASTAAKLVAAGDVAGANALIDTLSKNHALFGVDSKDLKELQDTFKKVLAGDAGALKELKTMLDDGIGGGAPFLPKLFEGLGLVLRVVSLPGQFSNADTALEQIQLASDTLGLGADGASFVLNALGKADQLANLDKFFGKIGGVASVVTSVVQAVDMGQELEKGHYGDAAVDGLNALSGVLLLIPGAQVFGAAAAIASFALDAILADRKAEKAEHASEKDAKQFLIDLGLDPEFAKVLSNVNGNHDNIGDFLQQVAKDMCITQEELFKRLNASTGEDRQKLLKNFADLEKAGELAKLPIFGPEPTLESLNLPPWLSQEMKEKALAATIAWRADFAQHVADEVEKYL